MSSLSWCINFAVFSLLINSCNFKTSPWDTNLPAVYRNLTIKHLKRLQEIDSGVREFKFAVIGDPQGTPEDFSDTIDTINDQDEISFILILGDITDYGLKHEYIWAAEIIAHSNKPVLTVIGNHDSIANGKTLYQSMFGKFNYTFTFGSIKFVMWNNNQLEFGTDNLNWLSEQIDENTIVSSHIPPVVDVHTEEQIGLWTTMQSQTHVMASLHGHRGGESSFFWYEDETPYYIVARNRGIRWAQITVTPTDIKIQDCHIVCDGEVNSL